MSNKIIPVIIIPARYASTRFPAKLLADLDGKTVIRRVYEQALKTKAERVIVAADHKAIVEEVNSFGGEVIMTSDSHPSGTDRVFEVAEKIIAENNDNLLIINLQGDEPLMPPEVVDALIDMMLIDSEVQMGTVAVRMDRAKIEHDSNKVKVVKSPNSSKAIYFTRAAAPFLREGGVDCGMLLHWGIYAYRFPILKKIVDLPESPLEKCEKLEQLRALEAGISIHILETDKISFGIDIPADLEFVRKILKSRKSTGKVLKK